jgi:acetyl esterase/lipase/lysophospholipase L1-like esterase
MNNASDGRLPTERAIQEQTEKFSIRQMKTGPGADRYVSSRGPGSLLTVLQKRVVLLGFCLAATLGHADFALRDGDTVVFLGDSITAARGYTKIVEHYTLMRFPERRVRFVNAGQGGDTASGCLARLERDVFSNGATVVTVAFGVNDIGWGMKADAEHQQRYLDGIRAIVEQCRARHVRPFICSAAITAEAPEKAEPGFLQTMTDEGLALAKSLGAGTIDLQRGMREVQRRVRAANATEPNEKKHVRLHADDGVHLNDLGQLAMAYALLKGLGAPAEVSSATLDAANGALLGANACVISEIRRRDDGLDFVRLDEGLPLNLGILSGLNHRWVPLPEGLNRYRLAVTNLPPGDYEIRAEGRPLGKVNADRLARGLNISSMTADPWQPGGPWDAQSDVVKELVDARDKLWMSGVTRSRFLTNHPDEDELERRARELDERLVALQRGVAKPYPYHFAIRKAASTADARPENRLTLQRGVTYGEADGEKLLLDAYLPSDTFARPRPAVLLVHGGGWEGGSRDVPHFVTLARSLAEEGFAVFSISYRLVKRPQNGQPAQNQYPAALDDCQRAVRWLRHHARDYGLAPDRLAALGDSAGGHLVALLGTTDTRDNRDPELARYSSRVNAVVDIFGPTDLTRPLPDVDVFGITPRRMVDNFLPDPARRREASPLFHVNDQTAPFLIFHGGKDVLVPIEHSRELHATLQTAGRDSTCIEFADEGHGFGSAEAKARMLKETLQFLRRTLNEGKGQ